MKKFISFIGLRHTDSTLALKKMGEEPDRKDLDRFTYLVDPEFISSIAPDHEDGVDAWVIVCGGNEYLTEEPIEELLKKIEAALTKPSGIVWSPVTEGLRLPPYTLVWLTFKDGSVTLAYIDDDKRRYIACVELIGDGSETVRAQFSGLFDASHVTYYSIIEKPLVEVKL